MKDPRFNARSRRRRPAGRVLALAGLGALLVGLAFFYRLGWQEVPSYPLNATSGFRHVATPFDRKDGRMIGGPVTVSSDDGSVHLVPTVEIPDTDDYNFDELASEYARYEPNLVLIDGSLGPMLTTDGGLVRKFGSAGALAVLAKRTGTEFYNIKPPAYGVYAKLSKRFSAADIVAYSSLSELYRNRVGKDIAEKDMMAIIERQCRAFGLENPVFADIEAFDDYWGRSYPSLPNWRVLSNADLLPAATMAAPRQKDRRGTNVLKQIAAEIDRFENDFAVSALIDATSQGKRVFFASNLRKVSILAASMRDVKTHQRTFFK